ncbi:MAG: hypothetical protein WCI61_09110 [Chloroflexota bacterium]
MFLFASLGRTFWLTALAAAASVAVAGTAFTASITVPGTNVATGATVIGGYTIGTVSYTLGSTPTNIDAVVVTLTTAGSPVTPTTGKIKAASAGSFYDCVITGTGPWTLTCATTSPQLTVAAADNLTVLAAQ